MTSPKMLDSEICGVSQICAKKAVQETALSRVALSCICCSSPTIMMVGLTRMRMINRLMDKSKLAKGSIEFATVVLSLSLGLPMAIGIFDPASKIEGKKCEEQFHNIDYLYFSKGL